MNNKIASVFIINIWAIGIIILLKIKNQVVLRGFFTNELILIFLLVTLPVWYFLLKSKMNDAEKKYYKIVAYFPFGLLIGMVIPIVNFCVMCFFIIPFLGYEKEKIAEIEYYRLEKAQDIISSGGQANFEVYRKGTYFDRCIEKFDASIYSKIELKEIGNSYKIIIK